MQLQTKSVSSYQGSLYHKIQALLSISELKALLGALSVPNIIPVAGVEPQKQFVCQEQFLEAYVHYLDSNEATSKLCVALSDAQSPLAWQKVSSGFIARPVEPVIHVKPFSFMIDQDGHFRGGMRGPGARSWGLEFKYPMLFMDAKTKSIEKTCKMPYPNNPLFAILRRWMRSDTKVASFEVNGVQKTSTFRIGKKVEDEN